MVVNFTKRRLEYYDSMHGSGASIAEDIRHWLTDEVKSKAVQLRFERHTLNRTVSGDGQVITPDSVLSSETLPSRELTPSERESLAEDYNTWELYEPSSLEYHSQLNTYDCGMFMLMTVDCLMRNADFIFSQNSINELRYKLMEIIIDNKELPI